MNFPYIFEKVSKEDISTESYNKLLNNEIVGIVVEDFLSAEEIDQIKNFFLSVDIEKKTVVNEKLVVHPISFSQFTLKYSQNEISIADYTEISHSFRNQMNNYIGINFEEKVSNFLKDRLKINSVGPINIEGSSLVPFIFRELKPGGGELIPHCENLFFHEFPVFFDLLSQMGVSNNRFSFFITIQAPDEGGELCCYNLNWKNAKNRITHYQVEDEEGVIHNLNDFDSSEHMLIKPPVGSMMLFAGGDIWHRVQKVEGAASRITLGGFVAETTNGNQFFIWS